MEIVGKAVVEYGTQSVKGLLVDCRLEDIISNNYGRESNNLVDNKFLIFLNNDISGFDPPYIQDLKKQFKYNFSYHIGADFYKRRVKLLHDFLLLKVL